jgi:hypothetical protein
LSMFSHLRTEVSGYKHTFFLLQRIFYVVKSQNWGVHEHFTTTNVVK